MFLAQVHTSPFLTVILSVVNDCEFTFGHVTKHVVHHGILRRFHAGLQDDVTQTHLSIGGDERISFAQIYLSKARPELFPATVWPTACSDRTSPYTPTRP